MTCLNYDCTHLIYHWSQKSFDGDASALWRLKMLPGCHLSLFIWLWYGAFMRHNLSARLRAAHVTAHALLFSRFSVLSPRVLVLLKLIRRLYILASLLLIHFYLLLPLSSCILWEELACVSCFSRHFVSFSNLSSSSCFTEIIYFNPQTFSRRFFLSSLHRICFSLHQG